MLFTTVLTVLTTIITIIIHTQHTQDIRTQRCQWKSTTFPMDTTTITTTATATTAYIKVSSILLTNVLTQLDLAMLPAETQIRIMRATTPMPTANPTIIRDSGGLRTFPEPCGSPSMTPCFTENSDNFICNKIQEEECQIFEAFVSLFNETNDSKLDTTTPSDDPSTIAPWTTRVMFGKYGFTTLLDTGATADIMRPDIADYMNLERHQCASSRTSTLADKTTHKCDEYVIADFNLYQVDGNAKPRKFFIADMPNSSHAIILGMSFINDFQLTPIWQPNVSPSLRININGITSTIWTSQTADNRNTTTDNIYMNMLITTEDLSESDQVPPNQFDNLCKHADDLLDTVSSE